MEMAQNILPKRNYFRAVFRLEWLYAWNEGKRTLNLAQNLNKRVDFGLFTKIRQLQVFVRKALCEEKIIFPQNVPKI